MSSLKQKAFESPIYATDGIEIIRTEPNGKTFIGFIKSENGEFKVLHDNPILTEVLSSGKEITKEEYIKEKALVNYINPENE